MSHRSAKRLRKQMLSFMGADFGERRRYSIFAPRYSKTSGKIVAHAGIRNTPGTVRAIYQIAKRNVKRHRNGMQAVRQGQV